MRPTQHWRFIVSELELDIILEALWEFKHQQDYLRPAAAPGIDKLRRRLLRDSIVAANAQDPVWGMAALPPEST